MANVSPLKIFMIFGAVSAWASKALEDGKITLVEAAELAQDLGPLLGIPVDIQIPNPTRVEPAGSPTEKLDEAAPDTVEERAPPDKPLHKPIAA